MNNIKDKYEYVGEFHQGVAIVVKNDLYGAILMGGHEIISPTYDYISTFKDGYAQAIRKGECVTINLSGRKCVCCENKIIEIGEAYDEVRNFYNGLACVRQKDKWGVIDEKGNEFVKPQFSYISDFINNVASYKSQNHKWGFITSDGNVSKDIYDDLEIDVDGSLITTRPIRTLMSTSNTKNYECKKVRLNHQGCVIIQTDSDLVSLPSYVYLVQNVSEGIVCVQNLQGFWGAMTINGQQIIPFEYITLQDFNEGRTFGIDKNKRLHLLSLDGKSIKILDTFTDARPFIHGYASIYKNELCGLVDSFGEIVLLPGFSDINYSGIADYYILTKDDKEGIFQVSTKTVIPPLYQRIVSIEKEYIVVEIPVLGKCKIDFKGKCFVYHNDQVKYLPDWCLGGLDYEDDICYAISNTGKWGIVNIDGKTICNPIYDKLVKRENNLIYTESNNSTKDDSWKHEIYGLFDIETQVAIPAKYSEYPRKKENFYVISKCYKKYGAIDLYGNTVVNPEYSDVEWIDGYFKIFNERGIGLVKSDGTIIIKPQYHRIKVIGNGLFKVKSNHDSTTYALHFETGKISERMYDEIGTINEEGYIPIVYNGRNGFLNLSGQLIVFDEHENCIPVPDKFLWAEDFNHGVAKVWDDSWFDETSFDYIDRDFNKVLFVSDKVLKIEVIVDKIVYKNHNRCQSFIFKLGDKYGLLSKEGKLLVDAKYAHLDYYSENLYFASIKIEDEFYRKYGIIDEQENIILPFEYSNVESYCGVVLPRRAMWLIKQGKLNYILPKEISSYALIENEGYGLVNKKGEVILEPIYQTIIDFKNGYFVIEDNKWYIIDNKEFVKSETNYHTLRRLAHNFYEISVLVSKTHNTYSGKFEEKKKYGILDEYGKVILEPKYDLIGEFSAQQNDLCFANYTLNGSLGVIDNRYNLITEPIYSYISSFKDGTAFAIKNDLYQNQKGFINTQGEFQDIATIGSLRTIKSHVSKVEELSNGYTIWQLNNFESTKLCAVVNIQEDIVCSFKYHKIQLLSNGSYLVLKDRNYELVDKDFNLIVKFSFNAVVNTITIIDGAFIVSKRISFKEIKYGMMDLDGREILPCIYDKIWHAEKGLLWIKKEKMIGLIKNDGTIIIQPKYNNVTEFQNGIAFVDCGCMKDFWDDYNSDFYENYEYKWGIINTDGKEIVTPKFSSIYRNEDGLTFNVYYYLNTDKKTLVNGSIDKNGNLLIRNNEGVYELADKRFEWQEDYKNGQSIIYYKGLRGKINLEGQITVYKNDKEILLFYRADFSKGLCNESYVFIADNNKKGVVSFENKILVEAVYDDIFYCFDYYIVTNNGKRGVILLDGEIIIDTVYDEIYELNNDSFVVVNETKKGVVSFDGKTIVNTIYDKIEILGDAYLVENNSKKGIFSFGGKTIIDIIFDKIDILGNAYIVIDKCQKGIVSLDGVTIIDAIYDDIKLLGNSYLVISNNSKGIISCIGKTVLKTNFDNIDVVKIKTGCEFYLCAKAERHSEFSGRYLYGLYSYNGRELIPVAYKTISYIDHELFLLQMSNGKYILVNTNGEIVNSLQLDILHKFGNSYKFNNPCFSFGAMRLLGNPQYAVVAKDGKHGIINNLGKLIVPFQEFSSLENWIVLNGQIVDASACKKTERSSLSKYDKIEVITDDFSLVMKDNLYGCINRTGNEIIPVRFAKLFYRQGLFVATKIDEETSVRMMGVVNFLNQEVIPFSDIFRNIYITNYLIKVEVNNGLWGAYTKEGKLICEPKYEEICALTDNIIKVSTKNYYSDYIKQGLIDLNGNELLPVDYYSIENNLRNGLIEIRENNRIGFIDISGQMVLKPTYIKIEDFIDGYAIVSKGSGEYGVINDSFREVIPCVFHEIRYEIETRLFKTDCGYKTKDGRFIASYDNKLIFLHSKYKCCLEFNDGVAIAVEQNQYSKKYALVDVESKEILPPIFDELSLWNGNLYKFKIKKMYGLADSYGNIVINNIYSKISKLEEDLASISVYNGKNDNGKDTFLLGFIDNFGKEVLPPLYEYMGKRSEGQVVVMKNQLWGLFDIVTQQVTTILNIDYLGLCKDGLCRFNVGGNFDKLNYKINDGLWGYMDTIGKIIISPKYERANGFSEGVAAVKRGGKWGFIDRNGLIIVPCEYDKVESNYTNGKGKLVKNDRIYVFDKEGKQISSHEQENDEDVYYGGYDDEPSIYDNPYYNDNLDMDQQSIDFWNSL